MSQPLTTSKTSLNDLLRTTGMWRASNIDHKFRQGTPTGFPILDQYLPGGGWPQEGLTELLHDKPGIGEFRLLAPALARLSQQQNRWLLMIAPPYIPYAPALSKAGINLARLLIVNPTSEADNLWVLEKALASQSCAAVLAWPGHLKEKQLRRLQVASKEGQCLGVLYRSGKAAYNASPAELRIQLYPSKPSALSEHSCLRLKILKRKGGWPTDAFNLEFNDQLNQMTPNFSEMIIRDQSDASSFFHLKKPENESATQVTGKVNQHVIQ